MISRDTLLASTLAAMVAGFAAPALAQAPAAPAPGMAEPAVTLPAGPDVATLREAEDDDMMVPPFTMNVDQIEDMNVVDDAGAVIGEVEEVLVDENGQPVALAIEVGGFLGLGDREAVVPIGQVRMLGEDLAVSLTKEQLEAMPDWDG